jgi:transcriptional regulator with XRE-family HTH domain
MIRKSGPRKQDMSPTPVSRSAISEAKGGPELSGRIREIRRTRNLSLRQLAALTDLPVATLSKVQNNLATLSYVQLNKLASGLGIDFSELFSSAAAETRTGRRAVTRHGQGVKGSSERFDFEMLWGDLAKRIMSPAIVEIRARSFEEAGGFTFHQGEEFVYVLSGVLEVHTQHYTPTRLEVGDSIYLDSTSGHAYVSTGKEPITRVLNVTTHPGVALLNQ